MEPIRKGLWALDTTSRSSRFLCVDSNFNTSNKSQPLITAKYSRMTYREDKLFTHQISELDFLLIELYNPTKIQTADKRRNTT